jgi:transketolase
VQDKFGHSGPAWEVLRDYGLTADAIADAVRSFVKEDQ